MASGIHSRRSVRLGYLVLGLVSLGVGMAGIVLPLVPTTGPILLSAFFFARSSERFHEWLLRHPRFGPVIRDYQAGLGIPLRAKVLAVVMIFVTFSVTMALVVSSSFWRAVLVLVAVGVIAFVVTRPTRRVVTPPVTARGPAG